MAANLVVSDFRIAQCVRDGRERFGKVFRGLLGDVERQSLNRRHEGEGEGVSPPRARRRDHKRPSLIMA